MSGFAILVLAAGQSTRFEAGDKLLVPLAGKPVLRWVAEAACASNARIVCVVTNANNEARRATLAGLDVLHAHHDGTSTGMGASIATGMSVIPRDCEGVLILPGDMPLITAPAMDLLFQTFAKMDGIAIVFAADSQGRQRNPVLWPRSKFAALADLDGPEGGKRLLTSAGSNAIAVSIEPDEMLSDIDTLADFNAIEARLG